MQQPTVLSQQVTDMQLITAQQHTNQQIDELTEYECRLFQTLNNLAMTSILYWSFHIFWWCYWFCLMSILFDIHIDYYWYLILSELVFSDTEINKYPRLTFDDEFVRRTDGSQPWHPNSVFHYSFGSTRDEQIADHIDYPSEDSSSILVIIFPFSETIEEYLPAREDIAIEDTQLNDVPLAVAPNNINILL